MSVCSRRVRSQSEMSGTNTAGQKQGQVNEGYVSEGQTSKKHKWKCSSLASYNTMLYLPLCTLNTISQRLPSLSLSPSLPVDRHQSQWSIWWWFFSDKWFRYLWGNAVICSIHDDKHLKRSLLSKQKGLLWVKPQQKWNKPTGTNVNCDIENVDFVLKRQFSMNYLMGCLSLHIQIHLPKRIHDTTTTTQTHDDQYWSDQFLSSYNLLNWGKWGWSSGGAETAATQLCCYLTIYDTHIPLKQLNELLNLQTNVVMVTCWPFSMCKYRIYICFMEHLVTLLVSTEKCHFSLLLPFFFALLDAWCSEQYSVRKCLQGWWFGLQETQTRHHCLSTDSISRSLQNLKSWRKISQYLVPLSWFLKMDPNQTLKWWNQVKSGVKALN